MISDADFERWLESSGEVRCALFELTFLGAAVGSPSASQEYKAYLSNGPYITAATDTPANQTFDECVLELPTFTRRMGEQLNGRSTQSYGDLIVANGNILNGQVIDAGSRSDWLAMNWDGRRIRQWIGAPWWAFSDFRLVLDGAIADVFDPGGDRIGFKISDKATLLDRPLMVTTLDDSGGADSAAVMPLCLGAGGGNITPKLIDAINLIYRFTLTDPGVEEPYVFSLQQENPIDVREDGFSLKSIGSITDSDATTDGMQKAAHGFVPGTRLYFPAETAGNEPPTPLLYDTPGQWYWVSSDTSGLPNTTDWFKVAPTLADALAGTATINLTETKSATIAYEARNWTSFGDGTFQLVSNPTGLITCDCLGLYTVASPGLPIRTAGSIIYEVLTSNITNTPLTSSDIDLASLAAFEAICDQFIGIYITERMTFVELLDKLVLSVGGWWGFSRAGLLQLGRLDLPTGSPVYEYIADDVALRSMRLSRRILPRAEIKLNAKRNWTTQTVFAGGVGAAYRWFYMTADFFVTGSATVTTWDTDPLSHRNVSRPEPQVIYMTLTPEAQAEADRQATLYQYVTAIWSFQTHQSAYKFQIGQELYIDHPKFTGYGVVVGISERIKGRSEIQFFAQLEDVYPTADIPVIQ